MGFFFYFVPPQGIPEATWWSSLCSHRRALETLILNAHCPKPLMSCDPKHWAEWRKQSSHRLKMSVEVCFVGKSVIPLVLGEQIGLKVGWKKKKITVMESALPRIAFQWSSCSGSNRVDGRQDNRKPALLKELCAHKQKDGNSSPPPSKKKKIQRGDLHLRLRGSSAQFNYIKRRLNWTLQTDEA